MYARNSLFAFEDARAQLCIAYRLSSLVDPQSTLPDDVSIEAAAYILIDATRLKLGPRTNRVMTCCRWPSGLMYKTASFGLPVAYELNCLHCKLAPGREAALYILWRDRREQVLALRGDMPLRGFAHPYNDLSDISWKMQIRSDEFGQNADLSDFWDAIDALS